MRELELNQPMLLMRQPSDHCYHPAMKNGALSLIAPPTGFPILIVLFPWNKAIEV